MHHLIERSIQRYRLMNGLLRCLAPCDPCGMRSDHRESEAPSLGDGAEQRKPKAETL